MNFLASDLQVLYWLHFSQSVCKIMHFWKLALYDVIKDRYHP